MITKRELQDWNRRKWENKNQAMYAKQARNQWPWFNEQLDPDVDEYLVANGLKGLNVLDVGTCSGSQAIALARRGHRVVGIDVSATALEQARLAAAKEPGLTIRFQLDDIAESSLDDSQFDLVLDRGCYDSIASFNHEEYVASVRRVLKPGGVLLLKTMSSDEKRFVSLDKVGGREVQMPHHFTAGQLQKLLAPHFVIEQLRDSCYYSSVIADPARARLVVLRNHA